MLFSSQFKNFKMEILEFHYYWCTGAMRHEKTCKNIDLEWCGSWKILVHPKHGTVEGARPKIKNLFFGILCWCFMACEGLKGQQKYPNHRFHFLKKLGLPRVPILELICIWSWAWVSCKWAGQTVQPSACYWSRLCKRMQPRVVLYVLEFGTNQNWKYFWIPWQCKSIKHSGIFSFLLMPF